MAAIGLARDVKARMAYRADVIFRRPIHPFFSRQIANFLCVSLPSSSAYFFSIVPFHSLSSAISNLSSRQTALETQSGSYAEPATAMVEKKGKSRDEITRSRKTDGDFRNKKRKSFSSSKKKKNRKEEANGKRPKRGPRLPNALQKELSLLSRAGEGEPSDGDEDIGSDDAFGEDVYEYEEGVPEEESMKNRRFDRVENYQFELPKDFEDWKVASDDDGDDGEDDDDDKHKGDDDEDQDDGRHQRMLEEITGLPGDAFGGKKKKDFIVSEAYPESEYNPSSDVLDGDGRISIQDLLDPLNGKSGFSKLRKSLNRMEKKSVPTLTQLAKPDQERLERKAAYELSKKDITKWEPLVKRNREAPTLYFDEKVNMGYSTIGQIASEFEPRTDFEKKIMSLVNQKEVVDAYRNDGAKLLELNKISVEDVKDRQERLAKMRSLLFRHEIKAKRIKKIKSKTYHRLLKKDKKKAAEAAIQMDPEAAKELAMKQEFKRAEERMTLKHKNSSKWAKRILKRGLDAQDEATREAFGEQLNQHAALTRKMNSLKESSSSDESSDGDDSDDMSGGSDRDMSSKLIAKAKEKTIKILEGDEELPKSGVLSLPFMVRGLQKRREAADEEAKLALEDYESSLKQIQGQNVSAKHEKSASSGRMVFGAAKKVVANETKTKEKINNFYENSESENEDEIQDVDVGEHNQTDKSLREVEIDPNVLREELDIGQDSVFKSFGGAEDPEPKTSYEVSYLASDSWKKVSRSHNDAKKQSDESNTIRKPKVTTGANEDDHDTEVLYCLFLCKLSTPHSPKSKMHKFVFLFQENDGSDTDSGGEMVDGILSSGQKSGYELPSQAELIQRAFAGDDVEDDFDKDKETVLNEENPEPEKPVLLPGWGQWTHVQKKKGLPSWMVEEHETAKNKRMEALKKRKDARLNHVIISEKLDKKAEKLHTKTLPYPYTSKEVFEQSIRMPIGPEFNPASANGALIRPEVVTTPGVIIKPISYEDISVRDKAEFLKFSGQKQRKGKGKNRPAKKLTSKA
ncbi:U3 ribonucleoprotein (Utp) family protein [Striga hermonthica]|uniref:U3 ribonucleoprotein (Utp) family protein n=1 Tax=Striga hermonthica TaxID=68872 RepID=A0A9N7MKL3_STRHE|nr:U3 ribonucleoprotein (Utp) family protein [Striga hermonthica]